MAAGLRRNRYLKLDYAISWELRVWLLTLVRPTSTDAKLQENPAQKLHLLKDHHYGNQRKNH